MGKGDRVAGYLPHIPETIAAFLATASLGAIWSVCPPEFGVNSVVDRLSQVQPKVLIAVDGYRFGGKDFDRAAHVAEIRAALPSLETSVWLPYRDPAAPTPEGMLAWDDAFSQDGPVEFESVPFDHPLYVLFTSGTTGLPKAVPHSHGGPLLEHHKWLGMQADLGPGDRFFWFTTTGWVVWNIAVSALTMGASIVVMDGSPTAFGLDKQWQMVQDLKITHLGASTAFVLACKDAGMHPGADFDLSSLRVGLVGRLAVPAGRVGVVVPRGARRHPRRLLQRRHRRRRHIHRRIANGPGLLRASGLRLPGCPGGGLGRRRSVRRRRAGRARRHDPAAVHAQGAVG